MGVYHVVSDLKALQGQKILFPQCFFDIFSIRTTAIFNKNTVDYFNTMTKKRKMLVKKHKTRMAICKKQTKFKEKTDI